MGYYFKDPHNNAIFRKLKFRININQLKQTAVQKNSLL